MIKARFDMQQPNTKIVSMADYDYIFICLNEEKKEEETENGLLSYFEYDYNEIIETRGVLDLEDIKENPIKYIDYSNKKVTIDEKVFQLEQENAEMSATLDNILTQLIPALYS